MGTTPPVAVAGPCAAAPLGLCRTRGLRQQSNRERQAPARQVELATATANAWCGRLQCQDGLLHLSCRCMHKRMATPWRWTVAVDSRRPCPLLAAGQVRSTRRTLLLDCMLHGPIWSVMLHITRPALHALASACLQRMCMYQTRVQGKQGRWRRSVLPPEMHSLVPLLLATARCCCVALALLGVCILDLCACTKHTCRADDGPQHWCLECTCCGLCRYCRVDIGLGR